MAGSEKSVFFDSTVIINCGEIEAFDLLIKLYSERINIVEEVKQEIFEESYRTEKVLKKYLNEGSIDALALRDPAEISLYNEYSKNFTQEKLQQLLQQAIMMELSLLMIEMLAKLPSEKKI